MISEAVLESVPAERIGVRLSPFALYNRAGEKRNRNLTGDTTEFVGTSVGTCRRFGSFFIERFDSGHRTYALWQNLPRNTGTRIAYRPVGGAMFGRPRCMRTYSLAYTHRHS